MEPKLVIEAPPEQRSVLHVDTSATQYDHVTVEDLFSQHIGLEIALELDLEETNRASYLKWKY